MRLLLRKISHTAINLIGHNQPKHYSKTAHDIRTQTATMAKNIVWMDLEMTGLDVDKDQILEIACLITDQDLNIVATGPDIIIHQPDDVLNNMNEWCIVHHRNSGLTEQCRKSTTSLKQAEDAVLKFMQENVPEKKCPIGGNSIYMDRLFLRKYMPSVNDYCHYRTIDVSTVKELAKRWFPREYSKMPNKELKHRALDDIKESINELKYYKTSVFKSLE